MRPKNNLVLIFLAACINLGLQVATCHSKPLLVTTIPKSGTHLLSKAIKLITGSRVYWGRKVDTVIPSELNSLTSQDFYMLHAACTPYNYDLINYRGFKVIILIRDPRDVLVSWAHWLKESPGNEEFYTCHSLCELISELIKNYRLSHLESQTLVEFFDQYLCWLNYQDVYITSFEKLVGPLGGSDLYTQENEIMNLAKFLQVPLSWAQAGSICTQLFGGTATFRHGQIGSWKEELTSKQKKSLKCMPGFNELLIKLKYEKDGNW